MIFSIYLYPSLGFVLPIKKKKSLGFVLSFQYSEVYIYFLTEYTKPHFIFCVTFLFQNMEAEKQVKFFQGCVASAFAERDHSIMEVMTLSFC